MQLRKNDFNGHPFCFECKENKSKTIYLTYLINKYSICKDCLKTALILIDDKKDD